MQPRKTHYAHQGAAVILLDTLSKQWGAMHTYWLAVQARSEEESLGLQTQLDIADTEVEQAHARLAALELEKERKTSQVCLWGRDTLASNSLMLVICLKVLTWHSNTGMTLCVKDQRGSLPAQMTA